MRFYAPIDRPVPTLSLWLAESIDSSRFAAELRAGVPRFVDHLTASCFMSF
jgi:hypothetical protein